MTDKPNEPFQDFLTRIGMNKPAPKPSKRLPSAGRWEDSQQGMRAARDDWANKNRG